MSFTAMTSPAVGMRQPLSNRYGGYATSAATLPRATSFAASPVARTVSALAPVGRSPVTTGSLGLQAAPAARVISQPMMANMTASALGSVYAAQPMMVAQQPVTAIAEDTPWGGGCPWQSDKTAFKQWSRAAIVNPNGKERKELYGFLAECFMDADADRDGLVSLEEFDFLVEKSATLPRRFGLAPSWKEMYGDVEHRKQERAAVFRQLDAAGRGFIGLEDWVAFSIRHITEKVQTITNTLDFAHLAGCNPEEFVGFCEVAVSDRSSEQFKSLYEHLFKVFVESDVEEAGMVHWQNFDILIEDAAKCPRDAGLAPTTAESYPTEAAKTAARRAEWDAIETRGTGAITFDEFLSWALRHIAAKVADYRAGKRYVKSNFATTTPVVYNSAPTIISGACPMTGAVGTCPVTYVSSGVV